MTYSGLGVAKCDVNAPSLSPLSFPRFTSTALVRTACTFDVVTAKRRRCAYDVCSYNAFEIAFLFVPLLRCVEDDIALMNSRLPTVCWQGS